MKPEKFFWAGIVFSIIFFGLIFQTFVWANVKQIKLYKEAFPDEKPKCSHCHVSDKPKKEDGEHELNDYGKKAAGIKAEPDADTYKAAGKE